MRYDLPKDALTLVTPSDVTTVRLSNTSKNAEVTIFATAGTTAPTDTDHSFVLGPGQTERNVLLSEIFPSLVGANRLWALCRTIGGSLTVG